MIKRILSILLMISMLCLMLPSNAQAATIFEVYPDVDASYIFDNSCTMTEYSCGDVGLPDSSEHNGEINFGPDTCCRPNTIDACSLYIPSFVLATCTEGGYTGDAYCNFCGKVYFGTETPALGHNPVGAICERCGKDVADIGKESIFGTTENGITWTFEPTTDTLRLSGSCDMDAFSYDVVPPWRDYAQEIRTVEIEEGVKSIGANAFLMHQNLESVTIPNTVEYIASNAFAGCSGLSGLTIPTGVTAIGESAFCDCEALTEIIVPNSVDSIAAYAFSGCAGLRSIVLPDGLTSIPEKMLMDCHSLESAEIPAGVTSIGQEAFAYNPSLKQIELPDGLKTIGGYAFTQTGLTEITIPESVQSIGVDAFASCAELEEVNVCNPECSIYDSSSTLGTAALTTIHGYAGSSAQSYAESYGYAFEALACEHNYEAVVTAPTCLTSGFTTYTCVNCKDTYTSDEVAALGHSYTYKDLNNDASHCMTCEVCGEVAFSAHHPVNGECICGYIEPWSFVEESGTLIIRTQEAMDAKTWKNVLNKTKAVMIEDGVESISARAFSGCNTLTSVTIPDSVTTIGEMAFSGCDTLTSVTIPSSVIQIDVNAFTYCESLSGIWVAEENDSYSSDEYGVLFNKGKTELICCPAMHSGAYAVPETVKTLAEYAFAQCKQLTDVTLPDGLTTIDDFAFYFCSNLTGIIIPDSVENIGTYAFSFCEKLAKVTIPSGLTALEDYVFNCCFALTSVTIPNSVTSIGSYAFCDCRNLTEITIPDSLTTIGIGAFNNCERMTEITIPEGLTEISERVFYNCEALKAVTIPGSVESIGEYAFQSCGGLTTVNLPEGLKTIGEGAFFWCGELEEITFPESLTSIGQEAFYYCYLQSVIIPQNVTYVGNGAFEGCMQLRDITVLNPDCEIVGGWSTLGEHDPTTIYGYHESTAQGFAEKYELPFELIIPDCDHADLVYLERVESTCSERGHREYWYCNDCKLCFADKRAEYAVTYNSQLLYLKPHSYGAGETCTACGYGLQFFVEMSDRESNGWGDDWNSNAILVYENDVLIEKLTFKSGAYRWKSFDYNKESNYRFVWNSGNFADECSFTITLGDDVIYECADGSALTDDADFLVAGKGWSFDEATGTLTIITQTAMDGRTWENVLAETKALIIEDGVTSIGDMAFDNCTSLTSLDLGNGVTIIGEKAFYWCYNLAPSITIPESVTSIGDMAFYGCDNLESVRIDAAASINYSVFADCMSIESVEIGSKVTSIDNTAFAYSYRMEGYWVDEANPYYSSDEYGRLYNKEKTTFISCPRNHNTCYDIPDTVTTIDDNAFYNCWNLYSITIPDSVTSIGDYAFSGCEHLEWLAIGSGVSSIGVGAIGMQELIGIRVDEDNAYYSSDEHNILFDKEKTELIYCPVRFAGSYDIPDSVTTIRGSAFASCKELTNITIPDSVTAIDEYTFSNCENLTTVKLGNSVASIEKEAFYGCKNLASVDFGNSVTSIGNSAFKDCESLTEICLPLSVTSVGNWAFYDCAALQWVGLSSDVTSVGCGAFGGCDNLTSAVILNPECKIYDSLGTFGDYNKVKIYGLADSTAMTYAETYGYSFSAICDQHDLEYVADVEPSCLTTGNIAYWLCNTCGLYFADNEARQVFSYEQTQLPISSHNYGEDEKCTVCGCNMPIVVEMVDSFGDGWNDNYILIYENDMLIGELTIKGGKTATENINYNPDGAYRFEWKIGKYAVECSFKIKRGDEVLYECSYANMLTDGETFFTIDDRWSFDEATGTLTVKRQAAMDACRYDQVLGNLRPWESLKEQIKAVKVLDGVTSIGDYAFQCCFGLTDVELPEGLTSIGMGAFGECTSLESIVIPDSVTQIGVWAFGECSALKSIVLPDGVTAINDRTFLLCNSLASVVLPDHLISIGEQAFVHCALTSIEVPRSVTSIASEAFYFSGLTSITIYNPDCEISASDVTLGNPGITTIYGHENSTAQAYAEKYGYAFEVIAPVSDETLSVGMNISAGAEMAVSYTLTAKEVADFEDFYLVVEKEMADGDPVRTTYGIVDEKTTRNADRKPLNAVHHPVTGEVLMYTATYEGINAKEMGDHFTTTLYGVDANGVLHYRTLESTSMKDYLLDKLNAANASDLHKTMLVDMLKYGTAAQVYFGYDTDALVTDALTAEQLAYATAGTPEAVDSCIATGSGANVKANIVVGSKVELNLSSVVPTVGDASAVRCVITDEEGKVLAEPEVSIMANIMFSAKYDNVGAREMRKMICATFYEGETPISKTLLWSVESYVAQTRVNAKASAEEIALVDAMLAYGDAVAAYLTATGQ